MREGDSSRYEDDEKDDEEEEPWEQPHNYHLSWAFIINIIVILSAALFTLYPMELMRWTNNKALSVCVFSTRIKISDIGLGGMRNEAKRVDHHYHHHIAIKSKVID